MHVCMINDLIDYGYLDFGVFAYIAQRVSIFFF